MGLHAFMVKGGRVLREEGEWHCRLSVATSLILRDGTRVPITPLVDTGSEVNLIRKGLLDPAYTKVCGPEVHFCAVNKQSLGNYHRQFSCDIVLPGTVQDTGSHTELVCPIREFDAQIDVDMILSYEWLARKNAQVYPRRHGMAFEREGYSVWVPGIAVGVPVRAGGSKVCRVRRGRGVDSSEP